MGGCILCGSSAVINRQESASRTIYNCSSCGVFVVSDLVERDVKAHVCEVSAYLMRRKLAGSSDTVLISFEKANLDKDYLQLTVEQIADTFPDDFTEQMDMALANLEMMSEFAGDEVKIDDLIMAPLFFVRKLNFEAMSFVVKSMQKAELIDVNYYGGGSFFPCGIIISPKGWDRLAELKRGKSRRDTVFVCTARSKGDICENVHKAAIKQCMDFGVHYSDNTSVKAEATIGDEIVRAVRASRLVICDLSEVSGEVYYAAALAKAFSKPCVLTCHETAKKRLQIDTDQLRVTFWNKYDTLCLELESEFRTLL